MQRSTATPKNISPGMVSDQIADKMTEQYQNASKSRIEKRELAWEHQRPKQQDDS